jgi:hypothetical protein
MPPLGARDRSVDISRVDIGTREMMLPSLGL